jgi:hypothetical protein
LTSNGPGVVLIVAEPGAGKSRLLTEVSGRLVSGYVLDTDALPPYFPLARAFEPLLKSETPGSASSVDLAPVLSAFGLSSRSGAKRVARLDPAHERLRLFEALAMFCETVAAERPLVLALDDSNGRRS